MGCGSEVDACTGADAFCAEDNMEAKLQALEAHLVLANLDEDGPPLPGGTNSPRFRHELPLVAAPCRTYSQPCRK